MNKNASNTVVAVAAILAVIVFAYGGANGWFRGPEGPAGPQGVQGSQGVGTGSGDKSQEEPSNGSNGESISPVMPENDLVNPEPHHGDSQPPENGPGSFDVGVKPGQIGVVFGYHIAWPKGNLDAGGEGCDLVILTTGWYENLQITDARYEVYDVPSSDYSGWVQVLGQQRADEQAADYGCPAKDFSELPQWESPFPSPPVTVQ